MEHASRPTGPAPGSIQLRRAHVGDPNTYGGRLEALPDAAGRLEASFSLEAAPALRIGQHVELCYEDRGSPRTFLAQVVSRRDGVRIASYRFRVKWKATDGLAPDLTRRTDDRIDVDEWTASSLVLAPRDGDAASSIGAEGCKSVLLDLSAGGAQALAPLALEAELFDRDRVSVSFRMGDAPDEPCVVEARIRWRSLGEKGVHYGLQFLFEDDSESVRQRERIAGYVEARRAQAARSRRDEGTSAA